MRHEARDREHTNDTRASARARLHAHTFKAVPSSQPAGTVIVTGILAVLPPSPLYVSRWVGGCVGVCVHGDSDGILAVLPPSPMYVSRWVGGCVGVWVGGWLAGWLAGWVSGGVAVCLLTQASGAVFGQESKSLSSKDTHTRDPNPNPNPRSGV